VRSLRPDNALQLPSAESLGFMGQRRPTSLPSAVRRKPLAVAADAGLCKLNAAKEATAALKQARAEYAKLQL
jgi:hypothetical protein